MRLPLGVKRRLTRRWSRTLDSGFPFAAASVRHYQAPLTLALTSASGRGCVKTRLPTQIHLHHLPQGGFYRNIAHNPKRVAQMLL